MRRFLSALSSWFNRSRSPEAVPRYVREDGDVARFVFRERDLYHAGLPKPKAFQPEKHPETGRYETSVCGLAGVSRDRLWELGRTIRASSGLTALAALRLSVGAVQRAGLKVEAAPEPGFAEHGVVVGWNPDPDAKDARLLQQQDLASLVKQADVLRPAS